MAASGSGDPAREIALGLAAAVQAAIAALGQPEGARSAIALDAASDVAELLELPGLSALLAACRPHAGSTPRAVANAVDRLSRLVRDARASGTVTPFTSSDAELAAIAGTLASQEWAEPAPGASAAEAVQSLSELLTDFEVDDPGSLARAVVTLPVAAALRAALDWIAAEWTTHADPRWSHPAAVYGGRLHVEMGEAALTLVTRVVHEPGLGPAGAVLALSGGALLPEPDGRWALRVPLHAARPAFLLVRQGELSLAVPWHAVARLRIVDDAARTVMTEPSLPLWSRLARPEGERPAALLALGLTRAWLHLDQVVWRVFARPEPAEPDALVPGGGEVVRPEEGGAFRVVSVEETLRGVPPLYAPPARARAHAASPSAPAGSGDEAAAAPAADVALPAPAAVSEAPSVAPPAPPAVPEAPAPVAVLGPEFVRPIGRTPSAAAAPPSLAETPPIAAPKAPIDAAAVAAPEPRRALIVDDSLVSRIEIGRVLERRGWVVEWVENAAGMWAMLEAGPWSAVFVDVFLPDASGRAHLEALVERGRSAAGRCELVALTRDRDEERLANGTGIERVLRKPFAPGAVERVARSLAEVTPGEGWVEP